MKHLLLTLAVLFLSQSMMAQFETQWDTFKRRPCGTAMLMKQNAVETRAIATSYNYVKHTGSVTIPVVLVQFSDVKFTINKPKQAFEQFFNGEKYDADQTDYGNGNKFSHGSVALYFKDMSDSTFLPKFKVYGPVTVPHAETSSVTCKRCIGTYQRFCFVRRLEILQCRWFYDRERLCHLCRFRSE